MSETSARRPVKSRGASWARQLAAVLCRTGLTPNQVSCASVVFAFLAAIAILGSRSTPGGWLWLAAGICIQLRLICNLMDGLLAVEGGLGTPDGDLYNETPDRLSDPLILVAAGYALDVPYLLEIGWLAGMGAILTAYVRMHGATLLNHHNFRGPMAKMQRMAAMTSLCLFMTIVGFIGIKAGWIQTVYFWSLCIIAAGTWLTVGCRLSAISNTLRKPSHD